jgi:hypothetical protein
MREFMCLGIIVIVIDSILDFLGFRRIEGWYGVCVPRYQVQHSTLSTVAISKLVVIFSE